ncbi:MULTISPECIES: hypothetical protein [Agrobacterium]|uniref:Secreted protein n=1 Tax=Agrobacterium salinitolerans TaxID=1183413 RepID=A0ABY3BTT5_9HYPH|nr:MULTISPECIES: hypothetical protein [Agrobacterium]MBA4774733.1 hypothetical protein [Hyphomicrobiales bacterium]MCZ7852806.1 hypothetical protein [Agrobacterium salinitolerans]MCZ7887970.1 hypothetical protein [Agrobacterium salinitolerans]MCZ7890801.1 hypothetical protein [Agrobacterium salinitolerans]MCZ7974251.1 hypothetical protein [Agrobacterium salinitolerans]
MVKFLFISFTLPCPISSSRHPGKPGSPAISRRSKNDTPAPFSPRAAPYGEIAFARREISACAALQRFHCRRDDSIYRPRKAGEGAVLAEENEEKGKIDDSHTDGNRYIWTH